MNGKTTFVIANQLTAIGYADRPVVIKKGEIVKEGDQETPLSLNGECVKLHTIQFKNGDQLPKA